MSNKYRLKPEIMQSLYDKIKKDIYQYQTTHSIKKITNKNMENFTIPTKIEDFLKYNYTNDLLRIICRNYCCSVGGNKNNLVERIYINLAAMRLQKIFRRYFYLKIYYKLRGPAFKNRKLCINNMDFLTMENVEDIPSIQFFSFTEVNERNEQFIYGFDIMSFYNLIRKNEYINIKNPYTRNIIQTNVKNQFFKLLRFCRRMNIPIITIMKSDDTVSITGNTNVITITPNSRALEIFHNMGSLGDYSANYQWFMQLNRQQLLHYIRSLMDIWFHRAGLSAQGRREIYPAGNPFSDLSLHSIFINAADIPLNELQLKVLEIMNRLISSGRDDASKINGVLLVLGTLTLLSREAALALPFLYEAYR